MRSGIMLVFAGALLLAAAFVCTACYAEDSQYGPNPIADESSQANPATPDPGTANPAAVGGPRIKFDTESHDWGMAFQGDTIEYIFIVSNEGTEPLKIMDVKKSCSCTTTGFTKEVPPGGSGTVKVRVESTKIKPGKPATKHVEVISNDPRRPNIELKMSGETKQVLEWTPEDVVLKGMAGSSLAAEFTLKTAAGIDLTLTDLKVQKNKDGVVIDEQTEVVPNKEWKVKLSSDGGSDTLKVNVNAHVKVQTDKGTKSVTVPIPVKVKNVERIEVRPSGTLSFNRKDTAALAGADGKPVTKSITIQSNGSGAPFKVKSFQILDVPEGLFAAELKEIKPGSSYEVAVTLKRQHSERFARGKLVIETDDATKPTIELKLFAHFDGVTDSTAPSK